MNHFKSELDSMQKNWSEEPRELSELRQKAFNRFSECGFPTKKWEDWQFTDFSPFDKTKFRISSADDVKDIDKSYTQSFADSFSIIILNGYYQPQLSRVPDGVKIRTLLDIFIINEKADLSYTEENPFIALNTSLMNCGLVVDVADDIQIDKPIHYQFISTAVEDNIMNHPRLLIRLGENSSTEFIEHYTGENTSLYWNNCVTVCELRKNSELHHTRIQEDTGYHTSNLEYHLQNDARLNTLFFNSGTELYRGDVNISINGQNAAAELNGLSLLKNNQHMDMRVIVDHAYPHCKSNQFFKYILDDKSTGVFNGRVIVQKDSQKTNSSQSNKNLLMSKNASMHSNPQLEIYADDVSCSHGSTTGELNEDIIYYLRSRGIDNESAQKLMVEGFAGELLVNSKNEKISAYLRNKLTSWLKSIKNG